MPTEVSGIPEAQAVIQGVVDDVKDLSEVHRMIAQAAEDAARKRAPLRTGGLSRSIHSSYDAKEARLEINPYVGDQFYWVYLEFGTKLIKARRYMARGISAGRKVAGKEYRRKLGDNFAKRAKSMRARNKASKAAK